MPKPSYTPSPFRTQALAARAEPARRAPAKAISRMDPALVAPAAADPAVLVDLDAQQRICLGALAKRIGITLANAWTPVHIATGFIVLSADPDQHGSTALTLDKRARLRLTAGIKHRLAVTAGSQVLVTSVTDGTEIRLMNLGTLADAFEAGSQVL